MAITIEDLGETDYNTKEHTLVYSFEGEFGKLQATLYIYDEKWWWVKIVNPGKLSPTGELNLAAEKIQALKEMLDDITKRTSELSPDYKLEE